MPSEAASVADHLRSMKKATVSCVKDLLGHAKELALAGDLDRLLDLSAYIINTISVISEDLEEFLAKEGSNLWEEKEEAELKSFYTVVKGCLASWTLVAIQLKIGQNSPGEA